MSGRLVSIVPLSLFGESTAEASPAALPPPPFAVVHEQLCQLYGCPVPYFHELDPLSELVSSLLSHRTKNRDSGRAFKALRAAFATWDEVRDAPVHRVEQAIAAATWPEQKAPRIQQVLRMITRLKGQLDLSFLADMDVQAARNWLEALPGVGPKTSAAVLLFSTLHRPALPVDAHHYRVAQRLGWIGRITEAAAHKRLAAMLPKNWEAQQMYDHHEVMMFHGQQCCYYNNPACGRCVLQAICPTAQDRAAQ